MRFQGITISKRIGILLLIIICTSCSTNKGLNRKILKSLKIQNRLIKKIKKQRNGEQAVNKKGNKKEFLENEKSLLMALESIQESNKAVIKKLKQKNNSGGYKYERRPSHRDY